MEESVLQVKAGNVWEGGKQGAGVPWTSLPHSGVYGKVIEGYKCSANSGFYKGENLHCEEFWVGQKGNEAV